MKSGLEYSEFEKNENEIILNPFIIDHKVVFTFKNDLYTLENNKPVLWEKLPKNLTAFKNKRGIKEIVGYLGNNRTLFIYQNNLKETFIELLDNGIWKKPSTSHKLNEVRITQIKKIENDIWICTSKGVFIMHLDNRDELIYKKTILNDIFTSDIIKDRDDNYWVTTTSHGIFVFPNIHIEKVDLPEKTGDSKVLESNANQTLYIGTSTGAAFQFNSSTKSLEKLNIEGDRSVSEIIYDPYRDQKTFLQDIVVTTLNAKNEPVEKSLDYGTVKRALFISADSLLVVSSNKAAVVDFKSIEVEMKKFKINYPKRGATLVSTIP
ncbi:hypothetical protein JCM19298_910 [Nonlabens ulvanivorans]|nr:hypothetical protein JCM19298_910 [Nonlabens ulvanivorans]